MTTILYVAGIALFVIALGLIMSIDALNASIVTLGQKADLLIASTQNAVPQAQVDAAQVAVDAVTAKIVAATPA